MGVVWTAAVISLLAAGPSSAAIQEAVDDLAACDDATESMCLQAASTLISAGKRGIAPTIRSFPDMGRSGQVLALGTLGQSTSSKATSGIASIAKNPEVHMGVRTLAIGALADRFHGKSTRKRVDAALIKLLKDDDAVIRASAARALGNRSTRENRKVLKALERAAHDEESMVRVEAVLGLGMSASPTAGPTLLDALGDTDPRVKMAAADAFTFVKFEPAIDALVDTLRSEDGLLRRVAGEALSHQTGQHYGEDYGLWREWLAQR